ncbi:hypothetical protein [Actinoplanes sp. GCM10030250]|uniref:hypothetical protein n=1 Tax=Actinoplanes sp. GCM10030250 TaxID=3273376 RepID=UPI00360CBDC5
MPGSSTPVTDPSAGPVTDPHAATADQARAAYVAAHPEPAFEDFTCPRCKAGRGKRCILRRARPAPAHGCHAPRYDKWRRAHDRWTRDADNAGRL